MNNKRTRNFNCRATDRLFDQLADIAEMERRKIGRLPSQADIIHRLIDDEWERLCGKSGAIGTIDGPHSAKALADRTGG